MNEKALEAAVASAWNRDPNTSDEAAVAYIVRAYLTALKAEGYVLLDPEEAETAQIFVGNSWTSDYNDEWPEAVALRRRLSPELNGENDGS